MAELGFVTPERLLAPPGNIPWGILTLALRGRSGGLQQREDWRLKIPQLLKKKISPLAVRESGVWGFPPSKGTVLHLVS